MTEDDIFAQMAQADEEALQKERKREEKKKLEEEIKELKDMEMDFDERCPEKLTLTSVPVSVMDLGAAEYGYYLDSERQSM